MKILVVTQSFFPDVDGGSGRFVFELSRRLSGRGHEVTLVGERATREREPAARLDGMRVFRYGSPALGLFLPWTFTSPLLVHDLAGSLFHADRFDLVWCHHYSPGLGGLLFAREKNIPGLFTYHASRYLEWKSRAGQPRRLNSRASRLLLRWWADRFRAISDVKNVRRRLGLPEDGFLVLTVRRLIARMGLENLVDAMKIVLESEPDAHLLIGGRGYLMERLKRRAGAAGLGERVKLLGYIDDDLLPEYYAASDLFVLPTLSLEGFGMVTLEALASGTPVLGTNAGATPEILRGLDEDLILQRSDPEYIADAILRRKGKYLTTEMRSRCREYVEQRYSWKAVTDRVERTMMELAEHGRA